MIRRLDNYNPETGSQLDIQRVVLPKAEERASIQEQGDNTFLEKGSFRSPYFVSGKQGWSIDSNGNAEFRNIKIGATTIAVEAGQSIQAAIDEINTLGTGGTVLLKSGTHNIDYDIIIPSKIALVGAGKDQTVLEFSGSANGIIAKGTSVSIKDNMRLASFTLQNSNNAGGIDIEYFDNWSIDNVRVTSCDQDGIKIGGCQDFILINTKSDNNTGAGFNFSLLSPTRLISRFTVLNCLADSNTGNGFENDTSATVQSGAFIRSDSNSNTGDGYNFNTSFQYCSISDCFLNGNDNGIILSGTLLSLKNVIASSNSTLDYDLSSATNISFSGNILVIGSSVGADSVLDITDAIVYSENNVRTSTKTNKKILRMKNTSGGALVEGDVVTFKAAAGGDEVTTTTTSGDDYVFGMAMESISNNNYGSILTEGYTTKLKVDGTTDIAIGDFLCTFTTAKIAQKATAGDMAFAIALEAYTTNDSNGVIDALLITPRKL